MHLPLESEERMSAVLGPIHEWMYNKVLVQEKIISEIASHADDKGWEHSVMAKDNFKSLEEVIDLTNIHGSLFGMIEEVENRYATLVAELLQADMNRYSEIEEVVTACGVLMAVPSKNTASDVYSAMEGKLLDGMPCDHAMRICEDTDSRVEVMRTLDTHSSYWTNSGLTGETYYDLRKAFVNGLLSNSGYSCNEIEEGIFEIVLAS